MALYAYPVPFARQGIWDYIAGLWSFISCPWALIGDFNEILFRSEVMGDTFVHTRAMTLLNMMDNCSLLDVQMTGGSCTWVRYRQDQSVLMKKLDRCLADTSWRLQFPDSYVQVLN
jgi:hypothetical protein